MRNQLLVRARFNDASVIEDDNVVGVFDGRDPMRNEDSRAVLHNFVESAENGILRLRVHVCEGIVKDKNFGFDDDRTRQCTPLALST